uniref:Uncharacterized protein n=1 Tax=candidate division WOR-3 bacterium TaxID=2052148 RepID=A0A7V3PT84_UNCW3
MKPCFIRARKSVAGWQEVKLPLSESELPADFSLVELLKQAPEFIGMALGVALPRAIAVIPGAASGRVFVAVDEQGKITIIGCPDRQAEGGISAMVGDLLAATGRLWQQPFATLAKMFGDQEGQNLLAQVKNRVGSLSPEQFKEGIQKSLQEGKFPLVIAVERVDEAINQMMDYLKQMNLRVRLISFSYRQLNGLEIVIPKEVGKEVEPEPEPAPIVRPQRTPYLEYTPTVTTLGKEEPAARKVYEQFPTEGTTPKQQEILKRLVYIDDLGLIRRGFEYFTPRAIKRAEAEGTIVIAVDPARWPFPKPEEVIVVVRTGLEHLAGFLKMKQQEVEDFLKLLPRDERKEHRGVVLLWARNVYEANQLVNELKALKEVSQTGVR